LILSIAAAGCTGSVGRTGLSGTDGAPGQSSLVRVLDEPAGVHCSAGGKRIDVGTDTDADGVLQDAEVLSSSYVCDGSTGTAGSGSLVVLDEEPDGDNCANGGKRISTGIDLDSNGFLTQSEVQSTEYVCNGVDGKDGTSALLSISDEPVGDHCATGGKKLSVGLDVDGSGTLDETERLSSSYVCNGATGLNSLVSVTPEPAGEACPAGGTRIAVGVDADHSGTLSLGEQGTSQLLCNGVKGETGDAGSNGSSSLVTVLPVEAGLACPAGGQVIVIGNDLDGSGTITGTELQSQQFVCNGVDGENGGPGKPGADGHSALVTKSYDFTASPSCAQGTQNTQVGVDVNDDQLLESDEVQATLSSCAPDDVDGDGTDNLDDGNPLVPTVVVNDASLGISSAYYATITPSGDLLYTCAYDDYNGNAICRYQPGSGNSVAADLDFDGAVDHLYAAGGSSQILFSSLTSGTLGTPVTDPAGNIYFGAYTPSGWGIEKLDAQNEYAASNYAVGCVAAQVASDDTHLYAACAGGEFISYRYSDGLQQPVPVMGLPFAEPYMLLVRDGYAYLSTQGEIGRFPVAGGVYTRLVGNGVASYGANTPDGAVANGSAIYTDGFGIDGSGALFFSDMGEPGSTLRYVDGAGRLGTVPGIMMGANTGMAIRGNLLFYVSASTGWTSLMSPLPTVQVAIP